MEDTNPIESQTQLLNNEQDDATPNPNPTKTASANPPLCLLSRKG